MSELAATLSGMERAARPGWHGIPPSRDRFVAPESLAPPTDGVHRTTEKAPPVWANLTYPGGVTQTVKGFAMAWTRDLVQVQWVEYSMAREAWVDAAVVKRRQLKDRRPHRDG